MSMGVCFHVCLYAMCMPSASRGQKKKSDPLGLESQIVVSHCVGAENQTLLVLRKSSQCSYTESSLQSPVVCVLLSSMHFSLQ